MKKAVGYGRKTVTVYLRDLSDDLQGEIRHLSTHMALLWNYAIDFCEEEIAKGDEGQMITPITLIYWLSKVRKGKPLVLQFPESEVLHEVAFGDFSSDLSREVLKMLSGAYQSFFKLSKKGDRMAHRPGKKKLGWFQTLAWSNFSLKERDGAVHFVLPACTGNRLWLPLDRYGLRETEGREIKHVKLSRLRHEPGFKLDITYAYDLPVLTTHPRLMRAIDLGAGDTAICDSTGHFSIIPMRRPDKHWTPQIASVSSRAENSIRGSGRWKRRMKARRIMAEKSGNQLLDFQKKLAYVLLDVRKQADGTLKRGEVDVIVVGEAKVRMGLAKSRGTPDQHRGAQNTGYLDRMITLLEQKCLELGIYFIKLPDPLRQGSGSDPNTKTAAAEALLQQGCERFGITMPRSFVRRKFIVPQGRGQSPKKKD